MEKYDVVAMGELLIGFTQNGYIEQGNPIFEANPGGAPCNVLAMYKSWEGKRLLLVKLVWIVLDYGSLSLTDEPVRTATVNAIEAAEKAGVWISFDPNLRKPLWERFL